MPNSESRRVFISSTTRDLGQYREVAQEVIQDVSNLFSGRFVLVPVSMDTQSQNGEPCTPLDVSRAWVRDQCDWVLLIVAWNYGYVPPGESCSVTEAEYQQAISSDKRCFVFLPGEDSDPPEFQYRALDRITERENLIRFWSATTANPAQMEGLTRFKLALRERRFDLFRDIEDFRAKLRRALTQTIVNENAKTFGPEIGDLGLRLPLKAVFREVKLLARLKRMHDTLHRIRQFGIRAWREELVVNWPDDAEPPFPALRKYLKGLPDIREHRGNLKAQAQELPDSVRAALPPLEKLLGHVFPDVPECGKIAFIESTEDFASWVQRLFTSCDGQMGLAANRLDRNYRSLADTTRSVLDRNQIVDERRAVLQGELQRSASIHERLQHVLLNHREWQKIHDELELIDSSIESEQPGDDDSTRQRRERGFRRRVEALVEANGLGIRALLSAATEIVTQDQYNRLGQWPALILKVGKYLDAFVQQPDTGNYEALRKNFDDLFFLIDLETLTAVEGAEERARAIEAGLQGRDVNSALGDL